MPPNSVVPLFDADNDIMYVKSTDGAGFPTIRAFAFQPIENKPEPARQYVTRITDELTGSEFLKAASCVDYAALMGILDKHMECIKAVVMSQIHALR